MNDALEIPEKAASADNCTATKRSVSFEDDHDFYNNVPRNPNKQSENNSQESSSGSKSLKDSFEKNEENHINNISDNSGPSSESQPQDSRLKKESNPKRERIGSFRRNLSIGNIRRIFKKQHWRSFSESPASKQLSNDEDELFPFPPNKSESVPDSIPDSPSGVGADDVFDEVQETETPQQQPSRLRHMNTLPRMSKRSADTRPRTGSPNFESKSKAIQIWQDKAT